MRPDIKDEENLKRNKVVIHTIEIQLYRQVYPYLTALSPGALVSGPEASETELESRKFLLAFC